MKHAVIAVFLLAACNTPPASPPDGPTGPEQKAPVEVGTDGAPDRATEPPPEGGEPEDAQKYEIVVGEDACETDADCVKAECCHPKACVAADKAPSCGDVACTLDCKAGTMDCYGGCLCQEGKCAAKLWAGPADG